MKNGQNIIHTSTFNFEYGSKASASRCNVLIESIFNSQILPELEKAIAGKIPAGMLVELSKLEINIGTINEKELGANLASRIRASLEEALQGKFKRKSDSDNDIFAEQNGSEYLLESIETFLVYGYFPYGMDESTTLDNLIEEALRNNRKSLVNLLKKHKNQERVLRRIANNLSLTTFDKLLQAIVPVDCVWIITYRKALVKACMVAKLNLFKGEEATQNINYLILKYLLNETSSIFNRIKFSKSILNEFSFGTANEIQALIRSVENQKDTNTGLISETLAALKNDQELNFEIERILELLNAGSIHSANANSNRLRDEIIRSIRDLKYRNLLTESLSETGLIHLIQLFDQKNAIEILNLITSFTGKFEHRNNNELNLKKWIAEHVFLTVNYLNEKAIRYLNKEEYLVFLANAFPERQISISELLVFAKTQKTIDIKKLSALLEDEQRNPEISSLSIILTKGQYNQAIHQSDNQQDEKLTAEFFEISKRKIISNYLDTGELSTAFFDLTRNDIQSIFEEFILLKDDFLKRIILRNTNPQKLIDRLYLLMTKASEGNLFDYFIHFFPEEYSILSELIAEARHQLSPGIEETASKNKLFIRTLAESNGGLSQNTFVVSFLENLAEQFAIDSAHFIQLWGSKVERNNEVNAFDNQTKKVIERDLKHLIYRFRLAGNGESTPESNSQQLVKKIILHFKTYPTVFKEVVRENKDRLFLIYTLLKLYTEPSQWISVEKALLSEPEFKNKIIDFQIHQENSLIKSDVSDKSDQKAYLIRIMSDEALFRKFIDDTTDFDQLISGNKKTQAYITQLLVFSPGNLSDKINPEFWKSVTLSFAALNLIEEKEFSTHEFAKAFAKHLLQKLKAIKEEELYYRVLDRMKTSDLQNINELYNLIQQSEKRKPDAENGSTTKVDQSEVELPNEKLPYYFSLLKFYAINGFLPWWANPLSFTELIEDLNSTGDLHPREFEEMFLQLEKEDQLLEKLIPNIPAYASSKFDQIILKYPRLKAVWQTIRSKENNQDIDLQSAKNIKLNLFKKLYALSDDEILPFLNPENTAIANQVKAYLSLSSYFYFRQINPAQWRKTVIEFAIDYNLATTGISENRFHTNFFKHLKTNHSQINWEKTLSQVYQLTTLSKSGKSEIFPEALKQLINLKTDHKTSEIKNKRNEVIADKPGVEVKIFNAGLILFWPFLTRLFEHLSLVKGGNFINEESRNRAVYVLQYLAYNRIDFPEHHLVLNKLLVGMDTQEMLFPFIELSEAEKESAESLQYGLINNWEKVKNSTPEGIQETFLQREGILRFGADKIMLQVDKKGVDVLLKSIPWNISLVKLSWMKKPIYVEWI